MNATTQLRLAFYMNKRASAMRKAAGGMMDGILGGAENNFERGAGALSYVPGVGFLGNLGEAGSQMAHGHMWRGLGNAALGVGSFFTGGLANDAVKGGFGVARGISKALPTMFKGINAARAAKPVAQFGKMYPSSWVSGGGALGRGVKPFVKNTIGTSAVSGAAEHMESKAPLATKDKAFDSVMNLGKNTGDIGGALGQAVGVTGDPRYLTPPATPSMPSFMSHN